MRRPVRVDANVVLELIIVIFQNNYYDVVGGSYELYSIFYYLQTLL